VLQAIVQRLTYGNVIATLALFVALGGTSYALTMPKNSVGSRELKSRSVSSSELRRSAVTSRVIKDRGVALRDMSLSARRSLRGATGPAGPPGPSGLTFFAAIDSGGGRVGGNATSSAEQAPNGRVIGFARSVAGCAYSATLARIEGGFTPDPPAGSTIVVSATNDGRVLVRTWESGNVATTLPFHLIVAC
jgi:hypothetical protein